MLSLILSTNESMRIDRYRVQDIGFKTNLCILKPGRESSALQQRILEDDILRHQTCLGRHPSVCASLSRNILEQLHSLLDAEINFLT